jgi:hypothetical protein
MVLNKSWWNTYSVFFGLSILYLIVTWSTFLEKFFSIVPYRILLSIRLITLIFFTVSYYVFMENNVLKHGDRSTLFLMKLILGVSVFFIFIQFVLILFGGKTVFWTVWLLFLIGIIVIIAFSAFNVWSSKANPWKLVLSYLIFTMLCIFIFGLLYDNNIEGHNLVDSNKEAVNGWNSFYFSAGMYYSSSLGDIFPVGFSKILSIIEVAVSFFFHVVIVSRAVSMLE